MKDSRYCKDSLSGAGFAVMISLGCCISVQNVWVPEMSEIRHTHTQRKNALVHKLPLSFSSALREKCPIDTVHPLPALLHVKLLVYMMRLQHLSEISSGCCGISGVPEFQGDKNLAILVWGSQTWLNLTHPKELLTILIFSSLSPISPDSECPEGGLEISLFNKQLGDSHETSLAQIHGRPYIFSSVLK